MQIRLLLIFCSLYGTALLAQNGYLVQAEIDPPNLVSALGAYPEQGEYIVKYSVNGGPFRNCQPYEDLNRPDMIGLMRNMLSRYDEIRFRFEAPGFKTANRNVVVLTEHLNLGYISFGQVQLQRNEIPSIDQVKHYRTAGGESKFRVFIVNPIADRFNVRKATIKMELPFPMGISNHNASEGPDATFTFSDELSVISTCDELAGVETLVYEKDGVGDFGLSSFGNLEFYPEQDKIVFSLEIDTRIGLLSEEESYMDFILPDRFIINDAMGLIDYSAIASPNQLLFDTEGQYMLNDLTNFSRVLFTFELDDAHGSNINYVYQYGQ